MQHSPQGRYARPSPLQGTAIFADAQANIVAQEVSKNCVDTAQFVKLVEDHRYHASHLLVGVKRQISGWGPDVTDRCLQLCRVLNYAEFRGVIPASPRWRDAPTPHNPSQFVKELQQIVFSRPVTPFAGRKSFYRFERPLLHGQVRFDVLMCRLRAFVPQPQCDHGHLDSCLQ